MTNKISRRDALKVGALGVLGGLAACSPAARATEALLPTYAPFPTNTSAPTATAAPAATASGATPTAAPTINTLVNDMAAEQRSISILWIRIQRTKIHLCLQRSRADALALDHTRELSTQRLASARDGCVAA